jgi:hypothetical protein
MGAENGRGSSASGEEGADVAGAGDRSAGDVGPDVGDEERPADEKLVPRPAPGLGPIGPAGDPAYMEGTLRGKGPRVGFFITVGAIAVLVLLTIVLVLKG